VFNKGNAFSLISNSPELTPKINGISFTQREVDVMACIVNGRTSKKAISLTLEISPGTVSTHTRNIMQKLQCSSWEQIRTFIEASGQSHFFRQYFDKILIQNKFQCLLREILPKINFKKLSCNLYSHDQVALPILKQIEEVLKFTGIKIIPVKQSIATLSDTKITPTINITLTTEATQPNEFNYRSYSTPELLILDIIRVIVQDDSVETLFLEFKNYVRSISIEKQQSHPIEKNNESGVTQKNKLNVWISIVVSLVVLGSVFLIVIIRINLNDCIRSELSLPNSHQLIYRSKLIERIKSRLYPPFLHDRISSVALCGVGGSGKTTIARMLGREHKGIVWEINAETDITLKTSFKDLAYTLATTPEDKQIYDNINSLQNPQEQIKRILVFVKGKLKKNPKWLIIFDNVESIPRIVDCLPKDPLVWGNGHVLITTQNNNTHISSYFNPLDVITLDELTEDEMLKLFVNSAYVDPLIISDEEVIRTKEFLKQLPPFPLDVTIAGTYIKQSKASLSDYLKGLNENNFDIVQKSLLSDIGDYTKTRQDIISLSIHEIIKSNPRFAELLLVMCSIDSQNIPKSLLSGYDPGINVDLFIQKLNQYSIISAETPNSSTPIFNMHRSIQDIGYRYLYRTLNLDKESHLLMNVVEVLEKNVNAVLYPNPRNQTLIALFTPHIKKLLEKLTDHEELFGILTAVLGNALKSFRFHDSDLFNTLENALSILNKYSENNQLRIARVLITSGDSKSIFGDFQKALEVLTLACKISSAADPNSIVTALALDELGTLLCLMGKYTTAIELLDQADKIYQSLKSDSGVVGTYRAKASAYRDMGNYQLALDTLKKCTSFSKKHEKHPITNAWAEFSEGTVYYEMGCDEKARKVFEDTSSIIKNLYDNDMVTLNHAMLHAYLGALSFRMVNSKKDAALYHIERAKEIFEHKCGRFANYHYMFVVLPTLGKIYWIQGKHDEARLIIEKSRSLLENHYGTGHVKTARIICLQGDFALEEGKTSLAEEYMQRANKIVQQTKHTDMYIVLESLSNLYVKKGEHAAKEKDFLVKEEYTQKAKKCLSEALDIAKDRFPAESEHIKRIAKKFNKL
jgi:tetratricopeptide (TPR) repeat protein/DNA-binding CsgD family transcriptional regulator